MPEKSLKHEYDYSKYKLYKNNLKNSWNIKERNFTERLLTFFNKSPKNKFIVEITNYGPLGFYNSWKNIITINMNNPHPISTIKHEMVHIMIEPFIKKYNINQKQKEAIVDSLLTIIQK